LWRGRRCDSAAFWQRYAATDLARPKAPGTRGREHSDTNAGYSARSILTGVYEVMGRALSASRTDREDSHGDEVCSRNPNEDHPAADEGGTLDEQARQLLRRYGDDADIIAAQRADLQFGRGDTVGGARWLKIFRAIVRSFQRLQEPLQ
jgi:hypothetical protein